MLQRLPTEKEIELCLNSLPFPDLPNAPVLKESHTPEAEGTKFSKKAKKQKEYYQNKVHNELRHLAWAPAQYPGVFIHPVIAMSTQNFFNPN